MAREHLDLAALEDLRESGDYEKIAAALSGDWHEAATFGDYAVRLRLLAAEIAGRDGRLGDMETMLAPYLKDVNHVPLGLAARALLMAAQGGEGRIHDPIMPEAQAPIAGSGVVRPEVF